jgi:hypothetical protein
MPKTCARLAVEPIRPAGAPQRNLAQNAARRAAEPKSAVIRGGAARTGGGRAHVGCADRQRRDGRGGGAEAQQREGAVARPRHKLGEPHAWASIRVTAPPRAHHTHTRALITHTHTPALITHTHTRARAHHAHTRALQ